MVVRALRRLRNRHAPARAPEAHVEGEAAHAWWAERDGITRKPNPKKRGPTANPPKPAESKQSGFQQYNTNASLYAHNQSGQVNTTAVAFALLGVPVSADWKEITLAYRAKAKEFHPDQTGGDDAKMMEINQAYATLRRIRGM
ncbi:MAG: J domain-containing protein [Actinobacteria bacterium]|jgi:DnaJ-domain-containing protein 1|nr:MAG: J domain-containing protein [Actinomycetota bacterium]